MNEEINNNYKLQLPIPWFTIFFFSWFHHCVKNVVHLYPHYPSVVGTSSTFNCNFTKVVFKTMWILGSLFCCPWYFLHRKHCKCPFLHQKVLFVLDISWSSFIRHLLGAFFSKGNPWASSTSIIWEHVRNTESQASPQPPESESISWINPWVLHVHVRV